MTNDELIALLLKAPADGLGTENLCIAAAERLEALVKQAVIDRAAYEGVSSMLLSLQEDCIKERNRAEMLHAAASAVAEDVCSYICPSVGLEGKPIPHDPQCIALRAALEGDSK